MCSPWFALLRSRLDQELSSRPTRTRVAATGGEHRTDGRTGGQKNEQTANGHSDTRPLSKGRRVVDRRVFVEARFLILANLSLSLARVTRKTLEWLEIRFVDHPKAIPLAPFVFSTRHPATCFLIGKARVRDPGNPGRTILSWISRCRHQEGEKERPRRRRVLDRHGADRCDYSSRTGQTNVPSLPPHPLPRF